MKEYESLEGVSAWSASLEGTDPCHDELYESKRPKGKHQPPASKPSGTPLRLQFGANEIVQGFIYSEIFARKPMRRGR